MPGAVRVKGLRELDRAFREVDKEADRQLRDELKAAADIVREDAAQRLEPISPSAAATLKTSARTTGAFVRQSKSKTTGKRPDFGRLQMQRALLPAVDDKQEEVERRVEEMLDRITTKAGF